MEPSEYEIRYKKGDEGDYYELVHTIDEAVVTTFTWTPTLQELLDHATEHGD